MILICSKTLENFREGLTSSRACLITLLVMNSKLPLDFGMLQPKALELIILKTIYRKELRTGRGDASAAAKPIAR
jgi:hypothetical protein